MTNQKWIAYALEQGFEAFEVYQLLEQNKSVSWFSGQVDSFVTSRVLGTSLRGIIGGKMANYSLEDPSDDNMEKVISGMIDQANAITSEEESVIRFPQETETVLSSKKWVRPSNEQIRELMKSLEEKAYAYDPRVVQVSGVSWDEVKTVRRIENSRGVRVEDGEYAQALFEGVAASENGQVKTGYKLEVIEDIAQFDQDEFVEKLCGDAVKQLGATSLPSGQYPVIIERGAMTSLFQAFTGLFSGDLISKGISPLKDKLEQKIFSDAITVVDDPRLCDAVSLANYDDEGCPTMTKTLVDGGVFKVIAHDSKSARKMGTESTGNGFRASYTSPVNVALKNCYIVPGERSLDEMCAAMGEGLVVTSLQGLHAGIDFVTTNFSLQCSGYWVKDGKRDHSVSLITIAANFLDLMKNAEEVGNDLKWSVGSVACPSVRFTSCAISGE